MKSFYLLLITIIFSSGLMAQTTAPTTPAAPPPLPLRQVSGIVKDKDGTGLPGAVVTLKSVKDTLSTSTDADGIFVFKEVKRATFLLTISQMGQVALTQKFFFSDVAKKIVMDPIELKPAVTKLKEVVINGTPTVIYKTDTVEFQASDYKVREGATVDELLKKIDGMEVGRDGSLTFQGTEITKAKLNGQAFGSGNVAQAIKTLPADIIKKAQVVDDYGELAARTGMKDKQPEKILNLTTKDDRSVGMLGTINTQGGNGDRYNARINGTRINAARVLTLIGTFNNTQTGVGGSGSGTTRLIQPAINYTDQLNKKVRVNGGYNYNSSNNTSENLSYGENYSYGQNSTVKNISVFNSQSTTQSNSDRHTASFDFKYDDTKSNIFQITPRYNYATSFNSDVRIQDNLNYFTTGFEHPFSRTNNTSDSKQTVYGLDLSYTYLLKNRTSITVQGHTARTENVGNGDSFGNYSFFADSTQNTRLRPDSLVRLLKRTNNVNNYYNAAINYGVYIGKTGALRWSFGVTKNITDGTAISDTVEAGGVIKQLHRLDDIFNYETTEFKLNVNYNFKWGKMDITLGADALPTVLQGTKVDNNNGQNVVTSPRHYYRMAPTFMANYVFSQTERISVNYYGSNQMPSFSQIQPFTDRSDAFNYITGNPNLRPSFNNSISARYNKYIANSKFTVGFGISASNIQDQVVYSTVQVATLISTTPLRYKTINQTTFINLNGTHSINGNYNLSKRINNSTFALNGSFGYGYNIAMSNGVEYHNTNWTLNQRFGPQLSFKNDEITVSPYIGYSLNRNFTTLAGATPTMLGTTSLAIDGRFLFLKKWATDYTATKSFVTGLRNFSTNPFVINLGLERSFFAKNNLRVSFRAYDLLHQNNFLQQTSNAMGVTNTLSNTQSRYFLIGLNLTLQKWGGKPTRGGQIMQRRGDGSFIYN